jgi:hypothetical protein
MDVQEMYVGDKVAELTLDLDLPYLYDMNSSLTVRDINNATKDYYITDSNKPYTVVTVTD